MQLSQKLECPSIQGSKVMFLHAPQQSRALSNTKKHTLLCQFYDKPYVNKPMRLGLLHVISLWCHMQWCAKSTVVLHFLHKFIFRLCYFIYIFYPVAFPTERELHSEQRWPGAGDQMSCDNLHPKLHERDHRYAQGQMYVHFFSLQGSQ